MRLVRHMVPAEVNNRTVREVERASIREFVERCSDHLAGRVLDYGCGQEPYRDIIEAAGGQYDGYDRVSFPSNISERDVGGELSPGYDAILCTQVAQYWPQPASHIRLLHDLIVPGGRLVITFPTTWAEVEPADLWRFTLQGMRKLLDDGRFEVWRQDERAAITLGGFKLTLGYGILARRL